MSYRDRSGISLDLSSSGRGLQQTLLLLAYIVSHPGSVLLLDEPDAHLEILRQRQIYQRLTQWAEKHNSQIIAASHSEVILNEAAQHGTVIAFFGAPHPIHGHEDEVLKSLTEIGFEHYSQAEQKGWVLYLEGSTNWAILKVFAEKLQHPAKDILERPYIDYVGNRPGKARERFYGLREAKPDLVGFCLFDRIGSELQTTPELREYQWKRREIENYLCQREVLMAWAEAEGKKHSTGSLFNQLTNPWQWLTAMEEAIDEVENALATLGKDSPWSPDTKVSDDFLKPLFETFSNKLELENPMRKRNYHTLVQYVPADQIDPEVSEVLDGILEIANQAKPVGDG